MRASGMGIICDMVAIRNCVQADGHLSWSRLMGTTTRRKFTEPLDSVYALLGLASPEMREAIPIDYSASIDRLYVDVATAWVAIERNLNLLSCVQHLENSASELSLDDAQWQMVQAARMVQQSMRVLPSWVPDWSQPDKQRHRLLYRENTYHASLGKKAEVAFCKGRTSITASGVHVDSVAVVFDARYDTSKVKKSLQELEFVASAASSILIDDDAMRRKVLDDDFWRTLVGNRTESGESPAPDQWAVAFKVSKGEVPVPDHFQPEKEPVERFAKFVIPLRTQLNDAMEGRRFFVTRRGLFGIGPCHMRRGDAICVLFGADLPMILRQHDDHWRLLGESYVHRLASGEGVQLHLERQEDFPKEEFVIR
ncbi:hypothetical protein A1O7_07529 [Cladophialophora yegresii CBS 114405]|uniref:Heterokaryon incompatibility domain-containing protein n=1 Tax=Cladophialophora yegresii CBS 114405 TaxID=1182544 RepID=W9VN91_9EURO|nr:uncharacterized protein A1O7_07529 [Cladophialophora yegresii CBS 114405]EXJ57182.1 hypothetical protein A1O7_07529 [Cladophialophora yegresii CBS 114405]